MIATYRKLVAMPWPRFVMVAVFIEGGIFFGGFTYVAADLNHAFRRQLFDRRACGGDVRRRQRALRGRGAPAGARASARAAW